MTDERPWQEFIDVPRILDLHADSIQRFGGDPSPGSGEECIERSLAAAWTAILYLEPTDPRLCFCAYALCYLVRNHCFVDGNKRIAWLVPLEVLGKQGLTLQVSDQEAEEMLNDVMSGSLDTDDVVRWMAEHVHPA